MMQLTAAQDGNLLDLLRELGPDSSKTTLRSWVSQGRVSVDGKQVTDTRVQVKQGQEVKVGSKCLFARENIKILFEDAHIVVILKPEGLLTVATDFDQEFTAHTVLKNRHEGQVYPVHRLDRETSGVMVFAYTEAARDKLKEVFYTHDIEREYLALVEGRPSPDKGTWESTLIEQADYSVRSAPGGKLAITHYEVLKQKGQFTLLRLKLADRQKKSDPRPLQRGRLPDLRRQKVWRQDPCVRQALPPRPQTRVPPSHHKKTALLRISRARNVPCC